jgi:hypothetical protein
MTWIERNTYYQGRQCIVCSKLTREKAAPLGIVSGTVPCHGYHSDREIMSAFLAWAEQRHYDQERLPFEGQP